MRAGSAPCVDTPAYGAKENCAAFRMANALTPEKRCCNMHARLFHYATRRRVVNATFRPPRENISLW